MEPSHRPCDSVKSDDTIIYEEQNGIRYNCEADSISCMIDGDNEEVEDLRNFKDVLARAKSKEGSYKFTICPGGNESDDDED
jgi:hypothetical protein